MAAADYRLCDVCGCKAFYDANLNYSWDEGLTKVEGCGYSLDYLGAWAVLCDDCAKTHEVKVVEKAAPGGAT